MNRDAGFKTVRATVILLGVLLAGASHAWGEPAPAVLDAEAQRIAAMGRAKNCVLAIFTPDGSGGGSGVVISPDGYALTNYHVAKPCGKSMPCGMADGKVYDAGLVSLDPTGDIALIKLFGRDDFPCAVMADSDRVRTGDWVFAMGNPFLLATDLQPTATYGIISGVHRYQFPSGTLLEYADCLQTDTAINPGNSGGPLFDDQGRLIGINGRGSFEKRGRVSVGVGYAVSINQIKHFLGALHSGRIVDHATLGATVESDADGRVVVKDDILTTSDAYRRGLRSGDEIISFGGRPISSPNGFKNVLGIFPKSWRVPLSYRRDGRRYDILVRLAGVHSQAELLQETGGAEPAEPPPISPPDIRPMPDKEPKGDKESKAQSPGKDGKPLPKSSARQSPRPVQPPAKPSKKPPAKPAHPAGPPVPEIVLKHFQEKRGFANYYFNALNQRRLWDAWSARGKLSGMGGVWTLSGPLETGGAFCFQVSDVGASLKLPSKDIPWTAGDDLGSSLLPADSGGLLPALYLWRRLATVGLDRFGDVYYYGTAPLVGHEGLADVLVATHHKVECWFYFDTAGGDLLAIEMFANEEADPCEIYFSDYREVDGRRLPGRMEVRYGNDPFATFKVDGFKFEKRGGS